MLTLTSPVKTIWHRLPAGAKLAALAGASIAISLSHAPMILALWAFGLFLMHLPGGLAFLSQALRMLRPLWPFVLILMLWGWWEGRPAEAGILTARMLILVAAANLVTMTTKLSDMLEVFERLARPLSFILPPRRLALAFALVIRFIPAMGETVTRLSEAWRARSHRRPGWRIVLPALLAAIDNADHAAEALRARGGAE